MPKRTVLLVCHNHPRVRPGGAERYAYELHTALRETSAWAPVFLARSGPPLSERGAPRPGDCIVPAGWGDDEYFAYLEDYDFDWFFGTIRARKDFYTEHFRKLLLAVAPAVVHFQHTLYLGYDLVSAVRRWLPDAPIVCTLHEFLPICHNKGQLLRVTDGTPCADESPRRCNECFPAHSTQAFFLRKRLIQAHLDEVDLFIAPSAFLMERYVDWGLPRRRLVLEDYGRRLPSDRTPADGHETRDRLGFFGQLSRYKGIDLLLEAIRELPEPRPTLQIHGANLDLEERAFRDRFDDLLAETAPAARWMGPYSPESIGERISQVDWVVVPSRWWENSPLVIQEAWAYGRPVICADIGGMAEKVSDGVNGLHFRAGDVVSLAETIRRAVDTPGLWGRLRAGIPPVHRMDEHLTVVTGHYERLLAERARENAA
jgi:glycosyltransferase involved in cell wall biosynthesis